MRELNDIRGIIADRLAAIERDRPRWEKAYAEAEARMQEELRPYRAHYEEIRRLKAALNALGANDGN